MNAIEKLAEALSDRYEIKKEIGAGGMATVFLARDLRHDRDVALKLLKPELGAVLGPERFLSEIRVTARLQHPNLLPLFDSGETDGQLWYVMPFVEGESLRAKMERERQLSVREAVRIAVAIAGALDYAHRHGVIHRDLKPENILLHEDQPLVADFGIALAVSNAGGERVTQTGLSLGTPQYMSPEQATGERGVGGRTDIYSLGAVLYEMLTGEPPHTGATVQAIIARVITDTPRSVRASRPSVPENVDLAVQKALEKVPADRFETAKEFGEVLEGQKPITAARSAAFGSLSKKGAEITSSRRPSRLPGRGSRAPWLIAVAATTIAAITALGWYSAKRNAPKEAEPVAFTVNLAEAEAFSVDNLAISPDGRQLVFTGSSTKGTQLYSRTMDDVTPRVIPNTHGASEVFFSPDGKWLVFFAGGDLVRVPAEGGSEITIARNLLPEAAWWTQDNRIILATHSVTRQRSGFSEVSPSGGVPKPILASDTLHGENMRAGIDLPDGKHFLFTSLGSAGVEDDNLALGTFGSNKYTVFDLRVSRALGWVDGHCICLQYDGARGGIIGVPIDLASEKISGDPVTLRTDVATHFAVAFSKSGSLAFAQGNQGAVMMWADAAGKEDTVIAEVRGYRQPRLSPDGNMIAMWLPGGTLGDVWIYNIAGKTLSRLSNGSGAWPEWTPDSKNVIYVRWATASAGIYMQAVDGSTDAQRLRVRFPPNALAQWAGVAPDGKTVLVVASTGKERRNIYYFVAGSDTLAKPWLATPADEIAPRFSPDGKWVAYISDESGYSEVYVRPFPGPGARVQISSGGADEPLWSRDGRTIYYRDGNRLSAASITATSGTFSVTSRRAARGIPAPVTVTGANYDVSLDGRKILFAKPSGGDSKLMVVANWLTDARRKMREGSRPQVR